MPMGGELGGAEIHEMHASHTGYAHEMGSPYKGDPVRQGYNEMGDGEYFADQARYAHGHANEMQGSRLIFEMVGSDVHEMPTPERRLSMEQYQRDWI